MAQQIINTGAVANDGTGDPLRTAFTETNSNFTEIYTAGPVGSNVRIANNTILTINTNGNLVLAPNGVGVVQSNVSIVPNQANVRNLGSSTARWGTVYAKYVDITNGSIYSGDLTVTGNLSAATVTTPELTVNMIRSDDSTVVKIQDGVEVDGDTLVNGNVTAGYFIGDGSQLTGISSTGNLAVIGTTIVIDADAPETSIYISPSGEGYAYFELPNNATANTVNTGLWNAAGNVEIGAGDVSNAGPTYAWLFGNNGNLSLPRGGIVYETNIPSGGFDGNTIALKPSGGTNADQQLLVYPTANVIDANHLHLTTGNLYNTELYLGNDDLYVKLANTGNVVINSNNGVGNAAQWTFATNGTTVFPGSLTGSGASPAPSINGFGSINSITVSASGNVTGNYILGNGSQLTSLPAPGVTQDITSVSDMSLMTYDGNVKYVSYATVEPATGTIKSAGNISAVGNITTTGNFIGNGAALSNVTVSVAGNIVGTQPNVSLVAGSYSWTFDNTGNTAFANGTVSVTDLDVSNIVGFSYDSPSANTVIDLTKQVAMLSGDANISNVAGYTLNNGSEGQVLFVTWNGVGIRNTIQITANLRTRNGNQNANSWQPFGAGGAEINPTNVTLIFSNNYWTTGSTF